MGTKDEGVVVTVALALEQALLSRLRSSRVVGSLMHESDFPLLLLGTLCVAKGVASVPIVRRVSDFTIALMYTMVLNTLLDKSVEGFETALALLNTLSIFLLSRGLGTQAVEGYFQYMFVSNLGDLLRRYGDLGMLVSVVASMLAHASGIHQETASLVAVQGVITWLRDSLPSESLLPSALAILYVAYPFFRLFPSTTRVMRFAVLAISLDVHLAAVPRWAILVAAATLSRTADEATATFASYVAIQLFVTCFIDLASPELETDTPIIVSVLVISIRIFHQLGVY